jgi:N-succinyl-L-ornithine transcarbamylase
MKQFLSVQDVPSVDAMVQSALRYKKQPLRHNTLGAGKRVGMLFLNPSLRTRLSTQIAARNLGMEAIVFNLSQEGWRLEIGEGAVMNGTTVEHVKDAAPVLGAYFDILCVRTFPSLTNREEDYSEALIMQLVRYAGVPVVSLESATLHPLQSLTDVLTITEHMPAHRPKIVLTWAPHVKPIPQCVANSFAQWINAWGQADFVVAHPPGYELAEQYTGNATITHDQRAALQDADFVYVKNWSSYKDYGMVLTEGPEWMLTAAHLRLTNNAKVMHCLPVRRNVELSDEVLDGPHSLVTQQAGNRVWAAQAVLSEILNPLNHE